MLNFTLNKNFQNEIVNTARQPIFYQTVGGKQTITSVCICYGDGSEMPVSQNDLKDFYLYTIKKDIAPVFNKVVKNLINIRNHLLLQLDLECGNITEEYFDKEESNYLMETENIPFEQLKKEINILLSMTNIPIDSEEISEILNCSINDAEKIIYYIIKKD